MQWVQHGRGDATPDRVAVQAEPGQLRPGNHPMLSTGQAGDRSPAPGWWVIVAFSATFTHHLARVAGDVLRVGDVCDVVLRGLVAGGRPGPAAWRPGRPPEWRGWCMAAGPSARVAGWWLWWRGVALVRGVGSWGGARGFVPARVRAPALPPAVSLHQERGEPPGP